MLRRHELMAAAGAGGAEGWNPGLLTDPDVAAWWRFLPGALLVDSSGESNTLTNVNGVTECTALGENLGCANFDFVSSQYLSRAGADLSANYPFKQGSSNTKVSICFWIKRIASHAYDAIYNHHDSTRGFALYYYGAKLRAWVDAGASYQYLTHGTKMSLGTLYFCVFTYDADTRAYRLHVYDCDAGSILGSDLTGTSTVTLTTDYAIPVLIGERTSDYLDARIGGMIAARKVFTPDESNQIREGTYGK